MYVNTSGLVLRETPYKDSSKILTILTAHEGKLTASAHGALRKNSKMAGATQALAFSEMTLYSNRNRWTLSEARSVEQFIGLRADISLLSLSAYFAELAEAVADEDSPNEQLLPLCLNALYALSEGLKTPAFVKPAFEFRLMAISGFSPRVACCCVCGNEQPERSDIDLSGGTLTCVACNANANALGIGTLKAIRYIINCDSKKLFSFSLSDSAQRELAIMAERYLLAHLDRNFRTLDYYHKIEGIK
ncbi:MAG: DNA repair protein RecO [Oscillospiraceae bacterium]|nr:DNA repair protein RecO [Oscillospiraceae bacterium]